MPITYTTPWFYSAGLVLIALTLGYFGWREIRRRRKLTATASVLWLLALMAVFLKLPSYLLDEITVDNERIHWKVGVWWDRAEGSILFAEVRAVQVRTRTRASVGRGNNRVETIWVLESPSGTTGEQVVFELWMENYLAIQAHFVAKGITFQGPG
jgi:hypothetical protein